jgi:hypothetical protein
MCAIGVVTLAQTPIPMQRPKSGRVQRQLALRTEFGARDVERAATQVQILASQTQRFVDPQSRTGDEANKGLQCLRAECRAIRTHFPRTTHDQPNLGGCHNIGCAAPADTAVSGSVKTVEIGRFENRVFEVDGAEVLRGLVIEG